MTFKRVLQADRSGISTMIAAILVVVVIIVAAGAVYVLLSNNGDEKKEDKDAFGLDSKFRYSIDGNILGEPVTGTMDSIVGAQNKTQFFMANDVDTDAFDIEMDFFWFYLYEKSNGSPAGSVNEGTTTLETIDGKKTVRMYGYEFQDASVLSFVDEDSKITYKLTISAEDGALDAILTQYELTEPVPYDPPHGIGQKFTYEMTDGADTFPGAMVIQSVVYGMESVYGICFTMTQPESGKVYEVSKSVQGLPISTTKVGSPVTVETIDGTKSLSVYEYDDDDSTKFYVDETDTNIIYRMVMEEDDGTVFTFNLTSYS